ncbi:MAG TPA: hypothetical protein VIW03_06095 [Anaeromyxobacter sp.]
MADAPDVRDDASRHALRVEHDALAERLAVRGSIDHARKGLYLIFLGLLSVGLGVKLAWDRWGTLRPGAARKFHSGPPLFLWMVTAAAVVLLCFAIRSFVKSRRLMRDEDVRYARYRELRARLGLDE